MRAAVSFLIPFRDAAPTLQQAVVSALDQAYAAVEIILVDDGSQDEGNAIARAWQARDTRVRLLEPGAIGLVAALNLGLSVATGRYVARLDADDEATPQRLNLQVPCLDADDGLVLVDGQVHFFREDGPLPEGMWRYGEWVNGIIDPCDFDRELLVESPVVHPAATFRRQAVLAAGGYRDGDFPEDYDLWLRLHAAGWRFRKVPAILVHMRDRPTRLTRTDPRYGQEGFRAVRRRWLTATVLNRARRMVLWGAGREGRLWLRWLLARGHTVVAVIDVDPRKIGRMRQGVCVLPPGGLVDLDAEFMLVAVGARGAREEIRQAVGGLRPDWREGQHWWALR